MKRTRSAPAIRRPIQAGPTAAVFGVGSDGFQGFPVESAGDFESDSWAAYVDVETDLTERLSGAVAGRYEDYDEFGDTFDWKVSARFEFTDNFAIRATANTGFRAPTPGQVNTLNVTTTANAAGNLVPSGTYPVAHPIALALGAVPLEPEESESYTAGLVWSATDQDQCDAGLLPHRDRRSTHAAEQHDRRGRGCAADCGGHSQCRISCWAAVRTSS